MISPCVGEISPNSCHSPEHSSQAPDAPSERLNELYPGKEEVRDDNGFKFEENPHIPQLQAASWKCDILTLCSNLPEADVFFSEYTETEWTKLTTLQLQSYVQLEKNNMQLLLAKNQAMKAQCDSEYEELIVELDALKSDIIQYEDYISSQCYSFNNETWEYLKNFGRDELRTRKREYLQQKMHLKQKTIRYCEEMKIYQQIMAYLNEEEIRRQQRMAEYSTNMLQYGKFRKHLLQNILNRVTEEQKEIETRKCLILNEMKASRPVQQNNTDCILKAQKLGCTFDFLLKHRVNSSGSVHAYNNVVDIFEKRLSHETPQSLYCLQSLLLSALENYKARLNREIILCLKKQNHEVSVEDERQRRLEMDEICPPVLPGFSDSKGASENVLLDSSILPRSADKNHEDIYAEFTMNKAPEVEATSNEELKKTYSSQPELQVCSVFREQPDDRDIIQSTASLELEKTSESNQTEEGRQDKPLKERAKKLGSKQQEYDAHKLQQVKPTAGRRAKMASLKQVTLLAELLEKKLITHVTNTDSEFCEIRKENETMRNKLDKILSILEIKNDDNGQVDKKRNKLLAEGEHFTTQDDRIGLQNVDPGGKGGWITKGESKAVSSRNTEKTEPQLLSQDHTITGTKEESIPAQVMTEWQLHSDGVPSASTSTTEITEDSMAHQNRGMQSDTAQVAVLGGKDADANKKESPGEITVQGVKVGLQISSDEKLSLEDQIEDHADKKRNNMFQKLSPLPEDDRRISKEFVSRLKRIMDVNKSLTPSVMKKLIGKTAAISRQSGSLYHGTIKLAVKEGVSIFLISCSYPVLIRFLILAHFDPLVI
jgi:hypothetical protein